LHGANRLASNSLLEGLVFGARAAQAMVADSLPAAKPDAISVQSDSGATPHDEIEALIARLQQAMGHFAGLLRDEALLQEGIATQAEIQSAVARCAQGSGKITRRLVEAGSLARVAHAILHSALARTESRGAHFRNDFPHRDDAQFLKHSIYRCDQSVAFESW
jgi:L-aspartate oxidase